MNQTCLESSEHLKEGFASQLTLSVFAIKLFFGLLQHGFNKLQQIDEKYNLVEKYLNFYDRFIK